MSLSEKISDAIQGTRSRTFLSDGDNDVLFNSTLSIQESQSAQITTHAVEKGSDVQDHIKYDPETVTLSIVITDDDLSVTDPMSFLNKTVSERLDQLKTWRDERELLTFYSYEKDYEDFAIESFGSDQSIDYGSGRSLSLTLKKIVIASSVTVDITTPTVPKVGSVAKKSTSTTAPVAGSKSLLKGLF
jgi:hypothetical protein